MCPHLHHERGQSIQPCLFDPFNNKKIHFLFCNNTSKPQVLFMYSYYIHHNYFFSKIAKCKVITKDKLPSHSINNLKPNKPCNQSSIKALYKGLPGKKGKLNMTISTIANEYAVVRSFSSSAIVGRISFHVVNLEILKNLEVLISCSKKSSAITTGFESYSELVSSSTEIQNEST